MSETTIDYTPLARRPSAAEGEQLRAEVVRGDYGRESQKESTGPPGSVLVGLLVGGTLVLVFAVTTLVQVIQGSGSEDVVIGLAFVGVGTVIGIVVWLLTRVTDRKAWRTTVQLAAFARANDLDFRPRSRPRPLPGVPRRGSHASVTDRVSWAAGGRLAEMGFYYRSSSGSESGSVSCRYLSVQLDVDLPALTFRCGRRGPTRGEDRYGPDAFEGSRHSLRPGGNHLDPRATVLFDEDVVALLTDPE